MDPEPQGATRFGGEIPVVGGEIPVGGGEPVARIEIKNPPRGRTVVDHDGDGLPVVCRARWWFACRSSTPSFERYEW